MALCPRSPTLGRHPHWPVCTLACGPSPPVPTLLCSQTSPPLHLTRGRSGAQPPPPPAGFSSGLVLSPTVWPQTILTPYLQPLCLRLFLQIRLGVPSFGLFLALSHLLCHPAPAPSPGPPSLYLEGLSPSTKSLRPTRPCGGLAVTSHLTRQASSPEPGRGGCVLLETTQCFEQRCH